MFSTTGTDGNGFLIAITGAFTANGTGGNGGITGGALDINDSSVSPVTNQSITGGSYSVTADGRGQATLLVSTPFTNINQLTFDFVLTSSAHGMITEFDGVGSGSGSLDLQTAVAQPAAGTYVFGLSGVSSVSATTSGGIPAAAAGAITLDASGNATGSFDYNNNETASQPMLNSGSVLNAGTSPGTLTLATSSGTFNFDVYSIDATHMKLIEKDHFPILSGDLFTQASSTFPSGQIAFTMAGFDYATSGGPLTVGGLMTSDGTATISAGEEDFDDAGAVDSTPQSITGSISAGTNGRYLLTLNNFENGQGGAVGTFSFAAYPSSGGIQLVEIDGSGVSSGAAFAQSNTTLAASQGYGLNLAATNTSSEEDDIAEFTTTTSAFSGLIDINDQGTTNFDQKLSGTYTADSPATGRGVLTANLFTGAYYTVDSSTTLLLEVDSTQLGVGMIQTQTASAKSNLAAAHLATIRATVGARKKNWRGRTSN